MKFYKTMLLSMLMVQATLAFSAESFEVNGQALGTDNSDEPYYHVPQYMPYYPTAAVIWPRVVEVPCTRAADGKVTCEGYNWTPDMGRAEYLFIVPKIKNPPQCCQNTKVENKVIEKIIYKEVPVKKGKE